MQPSQHGNGDDGSGACEPNAIIGNRDSLTKPLVRPSLVEVAEGMLPQHVQQVALAQDDHMVEASSRPVRRRSVHEAVGRYRAAAGAWLQLAGQLAELGGGNTPDEVRSELGVRVVRALPRDSRVEGAANRRREKWVPPRPATMAGAAARKSSYEGIWYVRPPLGYSDRTAFRRASPRGTAPAGQSSWTRPRRGPHISRGARAPHRAPRRAGAPARSSTEAPRRPCRNRPGRGQAREGTERESAHVEALARDSVAPSPLYCDVLRRVGRVVATLR